MRDYSRKSNSVSKYVSDHSVCKIYHTFCSEVEDGL
jgi:hypothetical protein